MKRFKDCLIALFVSFECLIALLFVLAHLIKPDVFERLGAILATNGDGIKWVALSPSALLFHILYQKKELLSPDVKSQEVYSNWLGYRMVSDRFYISVIIVFFCLGTTVGMWLFSVDLSDGRSFAIFMAAIFISVAAYFNVLIASITLGRVLRNTGSK